MISSWRNFIKKKKIAQIYPKSRKANTIKNYIFLHIISNLSYIMAQDLQDMSETHSYGNIIALTITLTLKVAHFEHSASLALSFQKFQYH